MEFCKQFNGRTQDKAGKVLPVVITVYSDKSFDFIIKTPPAAVQLMEAGQIEEGFSGIQPTEGGQRDVGPSPRNCRRQDARSQLLYR